METERELEREREREIDREGEREIDRDREREVVLLYNYYNKHFFECGEEGVD